MSLESTEEYDTVSLVRMEDIQPQDRGDYDDSEEVLETCIVDGTEYESVIDDDDSNIGSMVSIQSEEVVECEEEEELVELIVPEILQPSVVKAVVRQDKQKTKLINKTSPKNNQNHQDSWPTLEILPGGVINLADKNDINSLYSNEAEKDTTDTGGMMYACAKCSQSFKYLFCLVKHVKWHEDEEKKIKGPSLEKLSTLERELVIVKRARNDFIRSHKKQKLEVYERIAKALGAMDDVEEILP